MSSFTEDLAIAKERKLVFQRSVVQIAEDLDRLVAIMEKIAAHPESRSVTDTEFYRTGDARRKLVALTTTLMDLCN